MAVCILTSTDTPVKQDVEFGRLTRIGPWFKTDKPGTTCVLVCKCGRHLVCRRSSLVTGNTKSCGCLQLEAASKTAISISTTHGLTREFRSEIAAYHRMIDRCYDESNKRFHRYGGRGITVCQRWLVSLAEFLADMGPRPSPKHSLDRIDNDGNYEPGNCRWATSKEQGNNRSTSRILTIGDKSLTMAEWVSQPGAATYNTIATRIKRGWESEQAVFGKTKRVAAGDEQPRTEIEVT